MGTMQKSATQCDQLMVNVADICRSTQALGPGTRAVVWVQGCPFRCKGCIAPDWIPDRDARRLTPEMVVAELLADQEVTGLTFSGGEPMLQAAGLAEVARLARSAQALDLICFTGFRIERLLSDPPTPGVSDLLGHIDVLIDGQYVERLNDGRGLRGSSNQRVHFLSDRLRSSEYDFEGRARRMEIHLEEDGMLLVGVPPIRIREAVDHGIFQN